MMNLSDELIYPVVFGHFTAVPLTSDRILVAYRSVSDKFSIKCQKPYVGRHISGKM